MECARLRVKDVDFGRDEILIRAGKGGKDRVTMLPALRRSFATHLPEGGHDIRAVRKPRFPIICIWMFALLVLSDVSGTPVS